MVIIIITVAVMAAYRAKQRVTEFKTDFKSALKSIDETAPRSQKSGWTTYANVKANLPASLQSEFVAFSFDYPKSFELQPQSEKNFVKIEKYTAAGKGNTDVNFSVGYLRVDDPDTENSAAFDALLDDLGKQLAGSLYNYRELKRGYQTVDGINSRTALFQADFKEAPGIRLFGKTIVVHPAGKRNGVTILMLGTSMSHDIKSADDLGTKGDTADILRSFRFL